MFSSTLKLFSQVQCPDDQCLRSPCLFSHNQQHKPVRPPAPVTTSAPSRATSTKPPNLFIQSNNAKQNGSRPQVSARTTNSVDLTTTPDSPFAISGFDMARGLAAQSARPASSTSSRTAAMPNSASGMAGQSRAAVMSQTKTMSSGMIKRPNKVVKSSTVCHWLSTFPSLAELLSVFSWGQHWIQ